MRAKPSWVLGAVGLIVAALGLALAGPVGVQDDEEVRLGFGPVGIARGQTVVLNVALVALPPSPVRSPSASTTATVPSSAPGRNRPWAVVTLEEPNVTESLELPADQVLGEGRAGVEILPAVRRRHPTPAPTWWPPFRCTGRVVEPPCWSTPPGLQGSTHSPSPPAMT